MMRAIFVVQVGGQDSGRLAADRLGGQDQTDYAITKGNKSLDIGKLTWTKKA